MIVKRHQ